MSLREPPMLAAIFDCETGEQTIREFTEEEYADFDERQKVAVQNDEIEQQKELGQFTQDEAEQPDQEVEEEEV